jgi:nicotinamide riboside kinase
MRVSFTGAQSTGKTTLLNKCKEIYKDYKFVDEVTRYVRKTYDVKINEIGGTETQLYILAEHIKNHLRTEENLMLDRCILDGYVYTKYQVLNNKVSEQVLHAFNGVYGVLMDKLDYIFYTDPSDVKLVDDGERSVDFKFRDDIIDIFESLITYKMSPKNKEKIVRLSGSVDERMKIIKEYLNNEIAKPRVDT